MAPFVVVEILKSAVISAPDLHVEDTLAIYLLHTLPSVP